MYQCLVWGINDEYNFLFNQIKFEIAKGNMEVKALISKDKYAKSLDGWEIIDKEEIHNFDFDYIIVFNELRFCEIVREAKELGVKEEKIINGKIFKIPYFDFVKYCGLIENPVSIISNDCWGGCIYHQLGMKFQSPFINLFVENRYFLDFLSNLEYYLQQPLKMERDGDIYTNKTPIGYLGDGEEKILLDFIHYPSFEAAKSAWERRIKRLNIDNLFIKAAVGIGDEDYQFAERFDSLPYQKKVCFTTKEITFDSTVSIPRYIWKCRRYPAETNFDFPNYVRDMSSLFKTCDILEMLAEGKNFMRES